ncbi:MAG: hypothetical protein QXE06_08120 [Candidatus Bathyarchaeia archaeon]
MSQVKCYRINLESEEYAEALGFAVYTYLTGAIAKRDLYKGGATRYLGEYLEHVLRGKLAEIAFKKFLLLNFDFRVITDIDLPGYIPGKYLPDILAFKNKAKWQVPQFWVDVKALTEEQKWMLVRASSIRGGKRAKPRPYDAYVNVRVLLPRDHIGRLIKYAPLIKNKISKEWKRRMQDLKSVEAEILGFATYHDVANILQVYEAQLQPPQKKKLGNKLNRLFGQGNWNFFKKGHPLPDPDTGEKTVELGSDNCAIVLSKLRTDKHWGKLLKMFRKNQPLVTQRPPDLQRKLERRVKQLLGKLSISKKSQSWWQRNLGSQ